MSSFPSKRFKAKSQLTPHINAVGEATRTFEDSYVGFRWHDDTNIHLFFKRNEKMRGLSKNDELVRFQITLEQLEEAIPGEMGEDELMTLQYEMDSDLHKDFIESVNLATSGFTGDITEQISFEAKLQSLTTKLSQQLSSEELAVLKADFKGDRMLVGLLEKEREQSS